MLSTCFGRLRCGGLLVHAHIVHFEPGRELGTGGITSIGSPDGEIQDDVMRLVKGILSLAVLVEGAGQVNRVEKDDVCLL
jgi:hypothetical protein